MNFLINKVSIHLLHPEQKICLSFWVWTLRASFTVNYFFRQFSQLLTLAPLIIITLQLLIITSLISVARMFESSVHGKCDDRKCFYNRHEEIWNRSWTFQGLSKTIFYIDKEVIQMDRAQCCTNPREFMNFASVQHWLKLMWQTLIITQWKKSGEWLRNHCIIIWNCSIIILWIGEFFYRYIHKT